MSHCATENTLPTRRKTCPTFWSCATTSCATHWSDTDWQRMLVVLRSLSTSGSARCLSSPLDTGQGVAGRRRVSAQLSEKGPKDEADLVAEKLVHGEPRELTGDVGGDQRLGCEVVDRPRESVLGDLLDQRNRVVREEPVGARCELEVVGVQSPVSPGSMP
jgi:hypothetical protein